MGQVRRQPAADLETIVPLLIGQWRRVLQLSGPGDRLQTREFRAVVDQVQALQEGLFTGSGWAGTDYFRKAECLGAYTLYHWLLHYQQGLSLINELPEVPQRVLDIGAGPCPFAFAALRHGASAVYALDSSMEALQWGAQLCGRYGMPLTVRRAKINASLGHIDKQVEGQFDLIIVAHVLTELFPKATSDEAEAAHRFLEGLRRRLTPSGHLLVVDSSQPAANGRILALRDALVAGGTAIRAPCVWRGPCPARERSDSPCFAQRPMEKPHLLKEIQRAADIKLSSLKMSYFIACAPGVSWADTGERSLHRVISPPFEGHCGTTFYLCGTDGKKKLGANPQTLPLAARPFLFLKRGELVAIDNAAQRGNTLEVVAETSLQVVAACGKAWEPAS